MKGSSSKWSEIAFAQKRLHTGATSACSASYVRLLPNTSPKGKSGRKFHETSFPVDSGRPEEIRWDQLCKLSIFFFAKERLAGLVWVSDGVKLKLLWHYFQTVSLFLLLPPTFENHLLSLTFYYPLKILSFFFFFLK